MDLSFSSYLCLLLFVVLAVSFFLAKKTTITLVHGLTLFFVIILSIISVVDLELFKEWGFRIDASPLVYLSNPREVAASVASSPYVLLILSIMGTVFVSFRFYKKFIQKTLTKLSPASPLQSVIYLLFAAAMIIPIRGGLQLAPMNQSIVFFSKHDFANQAAINASWNFFWSFSKQLHSKKNPYINMPMAEAEDLVESYQLEPTSNHTQILNTDTPNVIIILWESFTSKVVPELGGQMEGVVPVFENLIHQGILFANFYANGDRSDKGLVSILSGFPAQPTKSIVKIPAKSSQLPTLTKTFNEHGYHTAFFHGGELEFANIKSYLLSSGFDNLIGKAAFQKDQLNSKWGAHDHILLDKSLKEINNQPEPFFNLIFTLSSHEPFEIPVEPQFPGDDVENLYKSSLHYTDRAVGDFINGAKRQPWYQNTLIIILADHGHRLLDQAPRYDKTRYHIPMLWLGGALATKDTVITKTCSQTDIPKTLLPLAQIDTKQFAWGKNILNPASSDGAFYAFNEGIAFISGADYVVYDHLSENTLQQTPGISSEQLTLTKAYLQAAYQDYLDK
jgi:phosphoglycerol transferase MdoB-like AlkP superfamily enzyme